MPKIQNNFVRGIIDKDNDSRLVDGSSLIDAENFIVTTTEGSNRGVGKNVPGNIKRSNYVTQFGVVGGKTIGKGINTSNNKIYNFICGDENDYVIEFDTVNKTSELVLQYTSGGVLNFSKTKRITNVDIIVKDNNDDVFLAWSGDENPPRIVNIEKAKTWSINGFSEDEISLMKPSPIFAPSINLTTSVDGESNNFIKDKFICFAYRYKYFGDFYSAPSSWSRIAFEPNQFELDYQTYENKGMLNLSNAVEISFNTGSREAIAVELLFRESDSTFGYVIDSFNKEKEGWGNNTTQVFEFSKSKIFKNLPEDQVLRSFDNVPLNAVAQAVIGNRLSYANYDEGYDIDVNVDFDVELVSTVPFENTIESDTINFVDVVDYSNVVDFEQGIVDGGSAPVDQMNYLTNELAIDLLGGFSADLIIEITPKAGYSATPYNVYVKEGATTLTSSLGLTGNGTINYSTTINRNIKIYVTSDDGIIYDCKLNYNINDIPDLSRYDYFAYHQLSYLKSGGFGATLVGDTIINSISTFDMSGFSFTSGNQIRINLELQSSLESETKPSVTFFYNLTDSYSDLADFITNSNFKDTLEGAFSLNFKNNEISNSGSIVSYTDFAVSNVGNILSIKNPIVLYNVTEPSTIVDNKYEFFLITSSELLSVTNSSFTSLHSNRDDEFGLIYLDEKGRKSTILTSNNNTVHIPAENSIFVNKPKITLNSPPPSWARYYKFAIKQPKKQYETIYANQVYKDGIYRWIRLVGENKSKVKEGDLLTVKVDYSGPLEYLVKAKVLEISTQDKNFIEGNLISNGEELVESSGLYMKIKQGNFDLNIDEDSFQTFEGRGKRRYATRSFVTTEPLFGVYDGLTFIPIEVKAGSELRFYVNIKAYGSIAFDHTFEIIKIAEDDYASIQDWWVAEIQPLDGWSNFADDFLLDWQFGTDGKNFQVKPWRDGTSSRDIITTVTFDLNFAGGILVFETEPLEVLNTPFFETPETFTITDGEHEFVEHILNDCFDCFCFGNGVESSKIQDTLIGKHFSIDSNPNAVNEEGYKRIKRFADITYSGTFNGNTNFNKLNEFNLSLANFKDDIEKVYGPIMRMIGQDTNLEIYQEDKDSIVYYGKDLLFNADGTTNLSRIEDVLGQQKTYEGEFGISYHPDSLDDYGFNSYHTDVKRGVVLKKSNNGLFEISSQGMRNYFKKLFRNNTINHINGKYDQFHDYYILNIQYNDTEYVTWVYSDKDNGWLGRLKFNPEDMVRINNDFVSFKDGEIYIHNQELKDDLTGNYNTFYGVESPSTFDFNYSHDSSTRKNYENLSIEGTLPLEVILKTDLDNGYIHKEDFEKKEGVYYAYVRNKNDELDTSKLSFQGLGEPTIVGFTLNFGFDLDSVVSIGDKIMNQNLQLVGTVLSKGTQSLVLDTVNNIVSGDFVLASKPQSIENQSLLGYNMEVQCEFSSVEPQEFFAINSEVSKSFE